MESSSSAEAAWSIVDKLAGESDKQATIDGQAAQLQAKDQEIERLTKWAQRAAQNKREELAIKEQLMAEIRRKEEEIEAMACTTRELREQRERLVFENQALHAARDKREAETKAMKSQLENGELVETALLLAALRYAPPLSSPSPTSTSSPSSSPPPVIESMPFSCGDLGESEVEFDQQFRSAVRRACAHMY